MDDGEDVAGKHGGGGQDGGVRGRHDGGGDGAQPNEGDGHWGEVEVHQGKRQAHIIRSYGRIPVRRLVPVCVCVRVEEKTQGRSYDKWCNKGGGVGVGGWAGW